LLAAWAADPVARCAKVAERPSVVEQRAAKAAAALKRWQAKLKLATTKVRKYKRQVAYYAKKAARA
jgi:hypothetical protein